jgi:hypothetical protein
MLDGIGEQLTSLFEIVAGVEQAVDLRALFGPLFNLVEIAIVYAKGLSVSSSDQSLLTGDFLLKLSCGPVWFTSKDSQISASRFAFRSGHFSSNM